MIPTSRAPSSGFGGISKRISPHTFLHTLASHLLLANYDIQTIQKLLGDGDVRTTMNYLQTVPSVSSRRQGVRRISQDERTGRSTLAAFC